MSIATGFQKEIKKKLMNFDSHIQIESIYQNSNNETSPFSMLNFNKDTILKIEGIKVIQNYVYKAGILQAKSSKNKNHKEVQGLIFKGLENQDNFGFFKQYLIRGKCPEFSTIKNDTIILSESTCQKLNIDINDRISGFFITDGKPKQRNFTLGGIYKTGLDKLDNQFGFMSINRLKSINKWGTTISIEIEKSKASLKKKIICNNKSKSSVLLYKWGENEISNRNFISINALIDTQFSLIAFEIDNFQDQNLVNIPDTIEIDYHSKNNEFLFNNTTGSGQYYTGGYEIRLNNYKDLNVVQSKLKKLFGPQFKITSIEQKHEEMFSWLNLIYQNVYIIIALMVAVAIINMSSTLLVLIVEKTKMIGILKALGMKNKSLRKIFVIHGGFLIILGFIFGNLLALIIIALQNHYGFLKLPQQNYYLSEVPMHLPYFKIITLNISAFIFCYIAMILPSYISTRISPIKAIASEI
jgi:lipoprotein-releasing system permease protein